jgi:hypothetical protein
LLAERGQLGITFCGAVLAVVPSPRAILRFLRLNAFWVPRGEFYRRGADVAAIALRLVASILAPTPASAQSCLGSSESIHRKSQATVLFQHEGLRLHPMPVRITKESHRPRVSNRTMSYRVSERITVTLVCFKNEWRRHDGEMKPPGGRRISPFRATK